MSESLKVATLFFNFKQVLKIRKANNESKNLKFKSEFASSVKAELKNLHFSVFRTDFDFKN